MFGECAFKGQKINATISINLSSYKLWITNRKCDWIYRQQCTVENFQVLINISQGEVIDLSPYGSSQGLYSHSELIWQWSNWNKTMEVVSTFRECFEWHEVETSNPWLQFGNSIQTNFWILASTFHPLYAWNRKSKFNNDNFICFFYLNQVYTFMACVGTLFISERPVNDTVITTVSFVYAVLFTPVSMLVCFLDVALVFSVQAQLSGCL